MKYPEVIYNIMNVVHNFKYVKYLRKIEIFFSTNLNKLKSFSNVGSGKYFELK